MAEKYMKKGVSKSIVCDNKYLNIINTRLVKTIMVHLYKRNSMRCLGRLKHVHVHSVFGLCKCLEQASLVAQR